MLHVAPHLWARGMPPELALFIVRETTRGLGCAHDKQVVHRAVSPHNILITYADSITGRGGRILIRVADRLERARTIVEASVQPDGSMPVGNSELCAGVTTTASLWRHSVNDSWNYTQERAVPPGQPDQCSGLATKSEWRSTDLDSIPIRCTSL